MPPDPSVTVTLTFPRHIARRLAALDESPAGHSLEDQVTAVLDILADHAQQGVYRSGSFERGWLCQAFGEGWLANLEPDPGHPGTGWQRPGRRQ